METREPLQAGRFYHVYNRGNARADLFFEERNYAYFLDRYQKYVSPGVDTFAYCLMKNHFHFLVRVKTCEVSHVDTMRRFSRFFNCYAKSINSVYGRTGSLFQKRFHRKELTDVEALQTVMLYIHMNPVKHRFAEDFRDYRHSSYNAILTEEPTFLAREEVVHWFGGKERLEWFHLGSSAAVNPASVVDPKAP
jgi:REP element-mobilizing transposase RayT